MAGKARNNINRLETEIEKSREDSNWKRVIELAEQLKTRSRKDGMNITHLINLEPLINFGLLYSRMFIEFLDWGGSFRKLFRIKTAN